MIYSIIFWPLFCFAFAWMQGRLLPAIRRTPAGEEATEQDNALHKVGTLAYFLPLLLCSEAIAFNALVALAARVALFDLVLNLAARRPAFEVGQTAFTDRLLRRISPAHPERLSMIGRAVAAAILAAAAIVVATYN